MFISLLIFIPKLASQQPEGKDSSDFYFAPGKIVVRFNKEISPVIPLKIAGIIQTGLGPVDILCQRFKVHTIRRLFPAPKYPTPDLTRYYVVKFNESKNLDELVDAFSKIPYFIEKAEKVGVHKFSGNPYDPLYNDQWHLNQSNDCDIDAPEAWNIQVGSDNVILAIPDSGVQYTHPDLNDNVWINWEEYNGQTNYDDDGNGYIDDIYGWNWDQDNNNPMDTYGHGTHCAGIAAAETNNDRGVAGIAGGWYPGQKGCQIMCLRIGFEDFDMDNAAASFQYATDMGATAINCSWKSWYSEYFKDAIDYALYHDVLIVAAAGNDNGIYCSDHNNFYLSMCPGVLVVAATDQNDERAIFWGGQASNYGPCIDVSAPGKSILSTCIGSGYCLKSGTSMAAPVVVGLAGLLKSEYSDWGRVIIRDAIVQSADPIDVEEDMGSGRVNAYKALRQGILPAPASNLNGTPTSWYTIDLTWQDNSDNENGFKIERNSSIIATVKRDVTYYEDNSVTGGINYSYRVIAYNLAGDSPSGIKNVTIPAVPPAAPNHLNGYFEFGPRAVVLTWSDLSNNEQGFALERKSEYEPWWQEIDRVGSNITSYEDYSVGGDTFYYYRVRAYNPYGYSSYSNTKRVYVPWY